MLRIELFPTIAASSSKVNGAARLFAYRSAPTAARISTIPNSQLPTPNPRLPDCAWELGVGSWALSVGCWELGVAFIDAVGHSPGWPRVYAEMSAALLPLSLPPRHASRASP